MLSIEHTHTLKTNKVLTLPVRTNFIRILSFVNWDRVKREFHKLNST